MMCVHACMCVLQCVCVCVFVCARICFVLQVCLEREACYEGLPKCCRWVLRQLRKHVAVLRRTLDHETPSSCLLPVVVTRTAGDICRICVQESLDSSIW